MKKSTSRYLTDEQDHDRLALDKLHSQLYDLTQKYPDVPELEAAGNKVMTAIVSLESHMLKVNGHA